MIYYTNPLYIYILNTSLQHTGSQVVDPRQGSLDTLYSVLDLLDVAAELLTEGERSGILGVRATNLHNTIELIHLKDKGKGLGHIILLMKEIDDTFL